MKIINITYQWFEGFYSIITKEYNILLAYWWLILPLFIIYIWLCIELDSRWGYAKNKFGGW